jgi:hypothetical protein
MASKQPGGTPAAIIIRGNLLGTKARLFPAKEGRNPSCKLSYELAVEPAGTLEIAEYREWPITGATVDKSGNVDGIPPLGPRLAPVVAECRVTGASVYQGRLQLMGTVQLAT